MFGEVRPRSAAAIVAGMDFDLTEEQRAIQDTARAFARDEMMPFARQWDEDEFFPVETLRAGGGARLRRHQCAAPMSAARR